MSKTAARIDRIGALRSKGGASVMMISYVWLQCVEIIVAGSIASSGISVRLIRQRPTSSVRKRTEKILLNF